MPELQLLFWTHLGATSVPKHKKGNIFKAQLALFWCKKGAYLLYNLLWLRTYGMMNRTVVAHRYFTIKETKRRVLIC